MKGLIKALNTKATNNNYFREVIETGKYTQIVVMSIPAGGEIGMETHEGNDQILYLVSGKGKVILDGEEADYEVGDCVLVHSGTKHNFVTVGDQPMKIMTCYAPAHHPAGAIHKTKEDTDKAEY